MEAVTYGVVCANYDELRNYYYYVIILRKDERNFICRDPEEWGKLEVKLIKEEKCL